MDRVRKVRSCMKTKISLLVLMTGFLLTGCASLFKAPPGFGTFGALTVPDPHDRESWIEARADQLESKGMSTREAKGQALTEAALRGR
jgi:hypothetical protein